MSALNQSQYNLISLNTIEIDRRYLSAVLSEGVSSAISTAGKYTAAVNLQETITSKVEVVRSFFVQAEGAEIIEKTISGYLYFYVSASGSENLTENSSIAGIYYTKGTGSESVSESSDISERIVLSALIAETVEKNLSIAEQIFLRRILSELIDSDSELESFEYHYCSLDVTIKPGSVLIIDAANYSVYLDGENVLYTHSGDWLDELNRTTESIKISGTGSTNLSASILYTEKYL